MAGILRPKAITIARNASSSGLISIQPPSGKVWWFKSTRYTVSLAVGEKVTLEHYVSGSRVTAKEWSGSLDESGETMAGSFSSPSGYLRVDWAFAAQFVFAWVGVEADVTSY